MLVLVIVLGLLSDWAESGLPIPGVCRIALPSRDNDYGRVQSQVIDSQAKLDALLKPLNRKNEFERGGGKDDYPAFAKALVAAKVNFAKENLVLIRHDEGSGSIRVRFHLREGTDGTLHATINREVPRAGTADVAHYCFVFVAQKQPARRLVFWEVTRVGAADLPSK